MKFLFTIEKRLFGRTVYIQIEYKIFDSCVKAPSIYELKSFLVQILLKACLKDAPRSVTAAEISAVQAAGTLAAKLHIL